MVKFNYNFLFLNNDIISTSIKKSILFRKTIIFFSNLTKIILVNKITGADFYYKILLTLCNIPLKLLIIAKQFNCFIIFLLIYL